MHYSSASALAALAFIVTPSAAHSWVEQMMVIDSTGTFTGNPGYCRNNTQRSAPGFTDLLMVHILPGQGQPSIEERQVSNTNTSYDTAEILPTDPMCKKTQQTQMQSNGSPRLQAAPGANIALRYEENGHVTLPANQAGKPANRGTVYIYGTTQPLENEIFLNIYNVWNADGTGGDKRGKLLATQPFDDGQCYQVNSGNISSTRQAQYPHTANELMGANLWCQNDIALPSDAPTGKPYALYWVWDWPTMPNVDPNLPKGKAEIYTTCMDVDITASNVGARDIAARDARPADINNAAIPSYMKMLANSASAAPAAQTAPAPTSAAPMAAVAPTASNAPVQELTVAGTPSATASPPASDAQAASAFQSNLNSEVASQFPSASMLLPSSPAAPAAPVTVTVTASPQAAAAPVTVTVSAAPQAASPQAAAPQEASPQAAAPASVAPSVVTSIQPSSTMTVLETSSTQTIYSASAPIQSGSQASPTPAASLNIQPPVIQGSSPPAAASPTAASPMFKTFQGTATPLAQSTYTPMAQNTSTPAVSPRGCTVNKCKMQKRSRILGAAAHRH